MKEVLASRPNVAWFEVHPENYMHDPASLASLEQVRHHYPLSLHGVALSLGSDGPLDRSHLQRLKHLVHRLDPFLVSEHLAWSMNEGVHFNDLLPLPYSEESLEVMCSHVHEVQDGLDRTILIENPSGYFCFLHSTMTEAAFLAELVRRTGCGILCDVNNVFVSAQNLETDPVAYLDSLPGASVGEMHLAGHTINTVSDRTILIDDHASRVTEGVWSLYREALSRFGVVPTLIEWDADIPSLDVLLSESDKAGKLAAMWSDGYHAASL